MLDDEYLVDISKDVLQDTHDPGLLSGSWRSIEQDMGEIRRLGLVFTLGEKREKSEAVRINFFLSFFFLFSLMYQIFELGGDVRVVVQRVERRGAVLVDPKAHSWRLENENGEKGKLMIHRKKREEKGKRGGEL